MHSVSERMKPLLGHDSRDVRLSLRVSYPRLWICSHCTRFCLDDASKMIRLIHLDAAHKGNAARYVNHSCDPNLEAEKVKRGGLTVVEFQSTRLGWLTLAIDILKTWCTFAENYQI